MRLLRIFWLLHPAGDDGGVEADDLVFGVGFATNEAVLFDGVAGQRELHDEGADLQSLVGIDGGPKFVTAASEEAGEEVADVMAL